MYLHLGAHCVIKSSDIIGIFNLREKESTLYENFVQKNLHKYKIVKLSAKEDYSSCIVTVDTLYLSGISPLTLKRRKEEDFGMDAVFKR
ncbi:MAG: DUF370 domain-containing protein [Acidaminococcaceae bacterium]